MIKLPSSDTIYSQLTTKLPISSLMEFGGKLKQIGKAFGDSEMQACDFPQRVTTYLVGEGLNVTTEDKFVQNVIEILSKPDPIVESTKKPQPTIIISSAAPALKLSVDSPSENKTRLLFKAIKQGDLVNFKALIEQNIDVNVPESTEKYARSPLYEVVNPLTHINHDTRYEMAELLLQKGAELSYKDHPIPIGQNEDRVGPFPLTSLSNDANIITLLNRYDVRPLTDSMCSHDYSRSLMDAISKGDLERLNSALSCGVDIVNRPINTYMTMGDGGLTPLMKAITLKYTDKTIKLEVIRHLLEAGADVNQPQKQAKSYGRGTHDTLPITQVDDLDILKLLEGYGIEPDLHTVDVATRHLFEIVTSVSGLFKGQGDAKTEKIFADITSALDSGASLTAKNRSGKTPLEVSQTGYFYNNENKERVANILKP